MSLAVGQHAFMPAVSGLLRSAASRSDWHPAGTKVPLYALSNVARSDATRSGYVGGRSFISIDGIVLPPRTTALDPGILIDSLQITDLLNYEANRCTFVAWGFTPKEGQRITVTIGSVNNRNRLFAGRILNTEQFYRGLPANLYVSVNAIDDTWGLDARKVSERYTGMTYEAIVKDLLAKYAAPTYTAAVEPGLGGLDEITFTNQDLTSALTQLAKRGGYQWLCDEQATVRLFQTDTSGTTPTILNAAHPSLDQFKVQRDLSQLVTRVYVEGGGVNAFAACTVGETILPVEDAAWYPPAGVVVCGPQRIRYSGKYPGGGGGLVGTGASPSGAPSLALVPGAGMSAGPRDYAVTFTTAAGESVAGPRASITTGITAPPPLEPNVSGPTAASGPGVGPDPGVHAYAYTFTTASGETTPSPQTTVSTGETAAPAGYPLPGAPTVGAGVDDGAHDYAVSFTTAIGETLVGPISLQVIAGPLAAPTWAPSLANAAPGTGPETGPHGYAVTFVTAAGETLPGPVATIRTGEMTPPASAPTLAIQSTAVNGTAVDPGAHSYAVSFVTVAGETTPGPAASITGPTIATPVVQPTFTPAVSAGSLTPGAVYYWSFTYADGLGHETAGGPWNAPYVATATAAQYTGQTPNQFLGMGYVNVYRTTGNTQIFYLEFENLLPGVIQPGLLFGYNVTDAVLVTRRQAPTPTPVIAWASVALSAIPVGDATVTSRKLYRTTANGSQLKFLAALADNTTVTYLDTQADINLGANAPTANTAAWNRLSLVNVATGQSGVTGRKLYRTAVNASALQLLATVSGNTSTTYTDSTPDASLGAAPPAVPTARVGVVPLTAIPTGESGVTARKLYRRSGGAGLRYLATLSGNASTTYTDTASNASLGAPPPSVSTAVLIRFALSAIAKGGALVTGRNLYRTAAGSSSLKLLATLADNTTTTYVDVTPDSGLGSAPPAVATATANQVALSAIPIGASSVIARKLYRTAAYGTQLQFLVTLADNTTTTGIDATDDAALGANVNTVDTSGLTQPQGNVLAGSTSLQIANIGAFPAEGWAVIGNGQQVIRYTGVSGNVLTGIPPSGPGAIQATIAYNSTVTASPQLVGIPATGDGMIRYPILKGDPVNLWVQVDGPLPATVPIVAIGDSLTYGWINATDRAAYTDVLAAHLGAPWTVINAGVPGDHTTGMLARFQTDVLAHQPAYVIIMGGTNDTISGVESVATVQANLGAMYAAAAAAGAIVVACTIWPGRKNTSWTQAIQGRMDAVNQWIRAVPPHVQYVVDGYVSMAEALDTQALRYIWDSGDGVHANSAGYTAFGEQAYAAVPWDLGTATPASRELRAHMGGQADGIIEGYLQDRRLSAVEATARGEAQLALRSHVEIGISYTSRDLNTRAGRTVRVNLPTQNVVMLDFQLRQVVIGQFGIPNLLPTFTASASTDRFSFEALIRAARKDGT